MFLLAITASLLVSAVSGNVLTADSTAPSFRVVSSRVAGAAPDITVRFADGSVDSLVLERFSPYDNDDKSTSCNFVGRLAGDVGSSVAVTGCDFSDAESRMHVTMLSGNGAGSMYSVDADGSAETIADPFAAGGESIALRAPANRADDGGYSLQNGDEEINPTVAAAEAVAAAACSSSGACTLPSRLQTYIQPGYDASMLTKYGTAAAVDAAIVDVYTHTQAHYFLPSLTTKVTIKLVTPSLTTTNTMTATGDQVSASRSIASAASADMVSWFCFDTVGGFSGTLGIAYLTAACTNYKVSVNEIQRSPAASARVLSHEIGHNLGMYHDFDSQHSGKSCTGFMHYTSNPTAWSSCSVSDFTAGYKSRKWGGTCFELLSADGTALPLCAVANWKSDNYCDDENNTEGCEYDGGDCCNNSASGWNNYCTVCECKV